MITKKLYVSFIVLMAMTIAHPVQANLVLKIDDPTTNPTEVVVQDEGSLDLADGLIGVVEYCTGSGFNTTCLTAISKPAEGTANVPNLWLNIDFLSWSGKLNISATDTDYSVGPTTGIAKIVGTALGVEGVEIKMWSDSSNQEFGKGELIYSHTDNGGNMIREESVESGSAGSLTIEVELESKGAEMNVGFQTVLKLQESDGTVNVPNVVGEEQSAAENTINNAGLQVGRITTSESASVPMGHVISQSPAGGADVSPGAAVDLEVSAGEAPQEVPDSRGLAGLWFDPAFDGEGYNIIVTETNWLLYYYGWRTNGERLWLFTSNSTEPVQFGKSQTLDLFIADEGTFADPGADLSIWGEMTIIFDSCTAARAQLEGDDGIKRTDIIKLAGIGGLDCEP